MSKLFCFCFFLPKMFEIEFLLQDDFIRMVILMQETGNAQKSSDLLRYFY